MILTSAQFVIFAQIWKSERKPTEWKTKKAAVKRHKNRTRREAAAYHGGRSLQIDFRQTNIVELKSNFLTKNMMNLILLYYLQHPDFSPKVIYILKTRKERKKNGKVGIYTEGNKAFYNEFPII